MRKLAREAVIFMLIGMLLFSAAIMLYRPYAEKESIRLQRDALKRACDKIPSWGLGEQDLNGLEYVSQAECTLVFGAELYQVRSYNAGVKLSQEKAKRDESALEEGERIRNLKIDYGSIVWSALTFAPVGFVFGLAVWLFYRLVRFAVRG